MNKKQKIGHIAAFQNPVVFVNMLYLGLIACAMCFATWNYSVTALGAVKSSFYICLVPVITVIMSSIYIG